MPEVKGVEIRTTEKAVLFHRYGDAQPQWLPFSQIYGRRETSQGSLILMIPDWLYNQLEKNAIPGNFAAPPAEQLELPLDEHPTLSSDAPRLVAAWDVPVSGQLSMECTPITAMTDQELILHFDTVMEEIHERGINIEQHYKGEQK